MRHGWVAAVLLASSGASALDCTKPPTSGFGGADYRAYADWCTTCGGTPSSSGGVSCTPGPNWGRSSGAAAPATPGGDFILDFFSGGAYSNERKLADAREIRRQAIDSWMQQDREHRREIFDRVAGEMKLGDDALPAPASPVTPPPAAAASKRTEESKFCAVAAGGRALPSSTQAVCNTFSCGSTQSAPLCCPSAYPFLNTCDCKCYKDSADIECSSYMACQHFKPK